MTDYSKFLRAPDADLSKPIETSLVVDTYGGPRGRAPEGLLELRAGICPYYYKLGSDGCNGCDYPAYSGGAPVSAGLLKQQVDTGLAELLDTPRGREMRVLSMFNAGSGLNRKEIPREALYYLFHELRRYKEDGLLPHLERVAVESRESFVHQQLLDTIVSMVAPLQLEIAIGYESHDDAVRNGDKNNSNGRIGLNKKIDRTRFERAIGVLARAGADAKIYVMMGSVPWLQGDRKIRDVVHTISYLRDLSASKNIQISIHLNPTYAAEGTPLHRAWSDEAKRGRRLVTYWEILAALFAIDRNVTRIGTGDGELPIYIGLKPEGAVAMMYGNNDGSDDEVRSALLAFNRNQDLGPLSSLAAGRIAQNDLN